MPYFGTGVYYDNVYAVRSQRSVHTLAPNTCKAFCYTGLYACWKLAEGQGDVARDYSGNGQQGTLNGPSGGPQWVSSDRGLALRFSGAGNFVESDTFFPDLAMPSSITLWVHPAGTQVEHADIFGNHGEPFVGVSLQQDGKNLNANPSASLARRRNRKTHHGERNASHPPGAPAGVHPARAEVRSLDRPQSRHVKSSPVRALFLHAKTENQA